MYMDSSLRVGPHHLIPSPERRGGWLQPVVMLTKSVVSSIESKGLLRYFLTDHAEDAPLSSQERGSRGEVLTALNMSPNF